MQRSIPHATSCFGLSPFIKRKNKYYATGEGKFLGLVVETVEFGSRKSGDHKLFLGLFALALDGLKKGLSDVLYFT